MKRGEIWKRKKDDVFVKIVSIGSCKKIEKETGLKMRVDKKHEDTIVDDFVSCLSCKKDVNGKMNISDNRAYLINRKEFVYMWEPYK